MTSVGAVALLAVTPLAACSSSTSGSSGKGGAGGSVCKKDGELNLAFIYASTANPPFQEMALGAQAAAKADGKVKLTVSAPPAIDPTSEVTMLQAAARTSKDGIAYQTVSPPPFANPLNQAARQKIPLVAVDAAPPASAAKSVPLFVGNSNTELGELLGQAFLKTNTPGGKVVLGNDIPSLVLLQQRIKGVQNVVGKDKRYTLSGPFDSGSEVALNYGKWKAIMQRQPDAKAFISVGANGGENMPLIEKQLGLKAALGSADITPKALQYVKGGQLFALSSPEHWLKGYIAVDQLIKAARTCKPLPKGWWNSGDLLINKSNVDSIIERQKSPEARTAWFQKEIKKQEATPPMQPLDKAD